MEALKYINKAGILNSPIVKRKNLQHEIPATATNIPYNKLPRTL
jgi:hypothetical protein